MRGILLGWFLRSKRQLPLSTTTFSDQSEKKNALPCIVDQVGRPSEFEVVEFFKLTESFIC